MMEHAHGPRRHYVVSLRYTDPQVEISCGDVRCATSSSRFSPLALLPLLRLARQLGDPIIHCYLFRSQVYGYLAKALDSRCRLILHEGGRIVQREHEPLWESVVYPLFLRAASRSTDMFIANSHHTLGRLEAGGYRGRLASRVVYNSILTEAPGFDPARRAIARSKLGLNSSSFVIGFAGRLVERKGWREFITSAESFREHRDLHWLIAGTGPEHEAAECIIAKRKLGQVRLLGFQSDMDSFYRALDLCVVPSHWEPHGLVQIEAQGRGVPVAVSKVPGMAETVNEGVDAVLFEPKNTADLVARVREVLNHSDLRDRLSVGSIANAQKFTIQHYHDQLESCYRLL